MDLATNTGGGITRTAVMNAVDDYEKYHAQYGGKEEQRRSNYTDMVNKYYDLVTSFYEYGWGEAFHFAHRWNRESLRESIKRHEHFIALNLELKPGQKVLDVGCGIGGPLREIAAFSGAHITGLNNNAYQITRGQVLNHKIGLDTTCDFVKADFMSIPMPDNKYDAVYAIEATCHAPDPVACYSEIKRILKPGQYFAAYEWVLTDAFDAEDKAHEKIKVECTFPAKKSNSFTVILESRAISIPPTGTRQRLWIFEADVEIGNGLPDIRSGRQVVGALEAAGFEVIRVEDLVKTAQVPWYQPLDPEHFSLSSFRLTRVGRFITRNMVKALEAIKVAPAGSVRVSNFLETAAHGLVEGGKKEIFSPLFFFLARKPMN